jgi:hypothetical protein
MTLGALAVPILLAVHAPVALAGGPLLSGYGGPGAGAQAIIGGTLLNGPGGGSGGGSGNNASGSSPSSSGSSSSPYPPSSPSSAASGASGVAPSGRGGGVENGSPGGRDAGPSLRQSHGRVSGAGVRPAGSAGAYPSSPHPGAPLAASVSAGASWFTGGDLLALMLVAGVLALVSVATLRLSGTGVHHE